MKYTTTKTPKLKMSRWSLIFMLVLVASCVNKFQARQNTKNALDYSMQSQQNTLKTLDKLSLLSNEAKEKNKILEATNIEIQKFINKETLVVQKDLELIKDLNETISDKNLDKSETDKLINQANVLLVTVNEKVRLLDEKTKVIVDFLNNDTYSKSEMGAIFKPGEYTMNMLQIKQGKELFTPTIINIISFVDKYKSSFSKFNAEIIITGYSDATPVEPGSKLYNNLSNYIKKDHQIIDNYSLNQKLSELRANSVKNLLQTIINDNKIANKSKINIKLTTLGKGQEIPKGLEDELNDNDFRRRVVTFYWVVLPQF